MPWLRASPLCSNDAAKSHATAAVEAGGNRRSSAFRGLDAQSVRVNRVRLGWSLVPPSLAFDGQQGDAIGDLSDRFDVPSRDQGAHARLSTKPIDQGQDPSLDGCIQRRLLINDEENRLAGHRQREHRPLAQFAGYLLRIVIGAPPRFWYLDQAEHALGSKPRARPIRPLLAPDDLGDLLADREERV
jgi:hypothetical protein